LIPEEVLRIAEGISTMKIRGAGRIARAAARALKIAAEEYRGTDVRSFFRYMGGVADLLKSTRPTAVSLPNAVNYVMIRLERAEPETVEEARKVVVKKAEEFIKYSLEAVERIAEIGSHRLSDGDCVLTHCNSSAAIAIIVKAHEYGKRLKVYATETRPKFQGLITVRALAKAGVDVTLIPDSSVKLIIRRLDKVVVGADTVAANGAVVNKIGTSMIALAAKIADVDFYVAAETYKFSPATVLGELVEIEDRDPEEVVGREFLERYPRIKVLNPAFDVTPPEYIDAIITEKGVISPQASFLVLKKEYGWALADHVIKATSDLEE